MTRCAPQAVVVLTAAALALLPFGTMQHTTRPASAAVRTTQTPAPATRPGTTPTPRRVSAPPSSRANRSEHRPPLTGGPVTTRPAPPTHRPAPTTTAAPPPLRRRYVDLGTWRVTKYCSTGNRTASDTWPAIGDAATLDRGIPFGTELRVVGDLTTGRHIDQTFIVTDRIGHGSQLDLYAGGEGDPTCEPRVNRSWGMQHLTVYVVRHG